MEITLALELNGYKIEQRGTHGQMYKNDRGVEMILISHGSAGSSLGSSNTEALKFVLEIINGAHAG